ncbi:mitochondrial carrier domain-containing protein [Hypoxylon sp. NC1633]|nr:mitochondrial carrier domain-containing protein [Hypoxylon sp. NC1633]
MTSGHPNNTGISADKFLPALHHAVSGSAGTLISTCVLYPLSLVITRLQVQRQLRREGKPSSSRKSNSQDDGTTTISPSGRGAAADPAPEPTAFYTGLGHDATKSVLDSFLFFLFYEWFRSVRLAASRNRRRRGDKAPGLGVVEELAVGMAAGACSRFFTTPIANVVTRKQTASLVDGEGREASAREIVDAIRKEKGLAGFWSGYSASLVLTLNPSITFFLQEFLKTKVVAADRWDSPAPHVTFLLAAVSKAVASAITYPFQTAKTRLQTGIPAVAPEPEPEPESRPKQEETEARTPAAAPPERNVEREVDAKLDALRAVRDLGRRSIFGTVAQIARAEGVASLYDGIAGELLKGFLGHGTAMLAKDVVHRLLFRLYVFVAGLLAEVRARRAARRATTPSTSPSTAPGTPSPAVPHRSIRPASHSPIRF